MPMSCKAWDSPPGVSPFPLHVMKEPAVQEKPHSARCMLERCADIVRKAAEVQTAAMRQSSPSSKHDVTMNRLPR